MQRENFPPLNFTIMKKAVITIAITICITGIILIICLTSTIASKNLYKNEMISKQQIYQNLKDSIQQFNKESAERVSYYEMNIVAYKSKIANEIIKNNARNEKELEVLKQK